jgi:hypothetical protein
LASSFAPAKVFVFEPFTFLWKPAFDDWLCIAEEVNFFNSPCYSLCISTGFFQEQHVEKI